jgi:hypothetical protein
MVRESVLNGIPIHVMLHVRELYEDNDPFLDSLLFQTVFGLSGKIISKNCGPDQQESNNGH